MNDLWKYDIETQHWTCIQESSGPSSATSAAANDGTTTNNDELSLSNHNGMVPQQQQQPVVKGKVPTRRFGYVSVVHNGKFVLFGGFDVRTCQCRMYLLHVFCRLEETEQTQEKRMLTFSIDVPIALSFCYESIGITVVE